MYDADIVGRPIYSENDHFLFISTYEVGKHVSIGVLYFL